MKRPIEVFFHERCDFCKETFREMQMSHHFVSKMRVFICEKRMDNNEYGELPCTKMEALFCPIYKEAMEELR